MNAMIPSVARLYSPSAGDLRPGPLAENVIDNSLDLFADPIVAWAHGKTPLTPELLAFGIKAAVKRTGSDAFRVAMLLNTEFHWPCDTDLVLILNRCFLTLGESRRQAISAWVARTGLRFPGQVDDAVEWIDALGVRKAGKVIGVIASQAAAWIERAGDGGTEFVVAESVVGNVTQALYGAQPVRPLGVTYEDAPAMAAQHAGERAAPRKVAAGAWDDRPPEAA